MRNAAQKFQRGALFLNGIFGRAFAEQRYLPRVQLYAVSLISLNDFSLYADGSAVLGAFGIERDGVFIDDGLQTGKARPVGDFQKGDRCGIAEGTHPAADGNRLPEPDLSVQNIIDIGMFHISPPSARVKIFPSPHFTRRTYSRSDGNSFSYSIPASVFCARV